jgi:TolB-like protein/DNA-binding winged helix-turn-helix (wHTH) protein
MNTGNQTVVSTEPRSAQRERYRIDDLLLDVGARRVTRDGAEIELPRLSFELLVELARSAPDTVSIDRLLGRVWGGVVVSSSTVAKRVELLRAALRDDSADPRYIALVRGYGYRLVPAVIPESPADSPTASDAAAPTQDTAGSGGSGVRRWLGLAGLAVLLLLVVGIWTSGVLEAPSSSSADAAPQPNTVAVLPFVSLTGDSDDELFADGLTEELGHVLANVAGLQVTGRTSSFYYKGRDEDVRAIGAALGVAHVLEGAVRRSGDRLRITAQLIETENGFHLWSHAYDRPFDDLLEVQQDIALNVVSRLAASVAPGFERVDPRVAGTDAETYVLYLKALRDSSSGGPAEWPRAQRLFSEVVERDPDFGPGWLRLAEVHTKRLLFNYEDYSHGWDEGWAIVADAVERARAYDAEPGAVETALGVIAWLRDGDLARAANHLERALTMSPRDLDIVKIAIQFAKRIGRLELAKRLETYLVERDPICADCRYDLARTCLYLGEFGEAEAQLRLFQALEEGGGEWSLGMVLLHRGEPEAALASFDALDHHDYLRLHGRVMALHDLGRAQDAAVVLSELERVWGAEQPLVIARTYAYLGQRDAAFEWLDRLGRRGGSWLRGEFQDPAYDSLREDPRWQGILEPLGVSARQLAAIEFDVNLPGRIAGLGTT